MIQDGTNVSKKKKQKRNERNFRNEISAHHKIVWDTLHIFQMAGYSATAFCNAILSTNYLVHAQC